MQLRAKHKLGETASLASSLAFILCQNRQAYIFIHGSYINYPHFLKHMNIDNYIFIKSDGENVNVLELKFHICSNYFIFKTAVN